MRVAFIYPPFYHSIYEENVYSVTQNFGVYPPLSVLYAAAVAEKAGHKVIVIDAYAEKITKEAALKKVRDFKAEVLAFHAHSTYTFNQMLEWAVFFKRNTGLPIMVGGFNLKIYPQETMYYEVFDVGIVGSLNEVLPNLLSVIKSKEKYKKIKGICFREKGRVVFNYPSDFSVNLEKLPFPARNLIKNELYYSFISQRKNFTIMLTSMGCPMRCSFCEEGKTLFTARTPEHVLKEIIECYYKYKIREIDFFDVSFTQDMKRAEEICKKIISKNLDISWSVRARVDKVNEELLRLMKKAGCERIYYGMETGSQELLNKMKKGITLEKVRDTVNITKKQGIKILGYFMTGCPGETEKTLKETVNYAISLDIDYVQFSKTLAKPKTELHKMLIEKSSRDYWSDLLLGKDKPRTLPTPWTILTPGRVHQLTKQAYLKFYFRPRYILKTLFRMKSIHEFFRGVQAALDMIFISK